MKINPHYILKQFGDESVLVYQNENSIDFSTVITLKGIAADIYNFICEGLSKDEIVARICKEYDISSLSEQEETVRKDVEEFIASLYKNGIVND